MGTTFEAILFIVCLVIIPSAVWCIGKRSIKVIWQVPLIIGGILLAFGAVAVISEILSSFPWLVWGFIIFYIIISLAGKKED